MFADPVENLKAVGIADGMIVADLGAGSGFYSIPAARMANRGKVYAIEVQKDFLPTIKDNAKRARLNNVEAIWGDVEKIGGTKIADGIADVVIISNLLFLAQNKIKIVQEASRILKTDGRVLFIDWADASSPFGPKGDMIFPPDKARTLFEQEKLIFNKDIDVGAHHYGMIFRKK